ANLSAPVLQHAGNDLEGRGLAGSIGADQAEDLSRPYLKADVIEGLNGAVALGQLVGRDDDIASLFSGACGILDFGRHQDLPPCVRSCIEVPIWMRPSAGIPGLA